MNQYRISDDATSNQYATNTARQAVEKFVRNYDTAEMSSGDTFTARVFTGADQLDLCALVTVTADGKGGVAGVVVEAR